MGRGGRGADGDFSWSEPSCHDLDRDHVPRIRGLSHRDRSFRGHQPINNHVEYTMQQVVYAVCCKLSWRVQLCIRRPLNPETLFETALEHGELLAGVQF